MFYSHYFGEDDIVHFRALFEFATISILITSGRGVVVAANQHALKEFGYTQEQLLGQPIELLIPQRFVRAHSTYHQTFSQKPQNRVMGSGLELFAKRSDDSEFPVDISLSSYKINDQSFVFAFINNITERRKAQQQINHLKNALDAKVILRTKELNETLSTLEKTNQLLQEAKSFQQALLDNAGAIIIATDAQGMIKMANKEAAVLLQYDPSELIDKKNLVELHDAEEIAKKRRDSGVPHPANIASAFTVLTENTKLSTNQEDAFHYRRKDGSKFPIALSINNLSNQEGITTGYIAIAIDITDRKNIEAELRTALQKEKELGELKSRFVSIASHEFKTPLSTILTSVYLISQYTTTESQEKREKHIDRIVNSVEMLTDMLNDLLSVGKIEEGRVEVKYAMIDLEVLAQTIISEMSLLLRPGQKIDYQHRGEPKVMTDPSLMRHILTNLLSNAIKFSPEGSPIEVLTTNKSEALTLTVEDHGIGISAEDQQHLLERFFRGTNASNHQGTGLGLHIASKYAALMQGQLTWESALEQGTTFKVTFTKKSAK